jgi:hypothetical protein
VAEERQKGSVLARGRRGGMTGAMLSYVTSEW